VSKEVPPFNSLVRGEAFGLNELETDPLSMVRRKALRYLELFRRDRQTDGQTDIRLANASLNYVARLKICDTRRAGCMTLNDVAHRITAKS